MAVTLAADVLRQYERFSLYNSPFVAHDSGCAVDLYPGPDARTPDPDPGTVDAPSPVAGEVVDTLTVSAPPRDYAADEDHLVVVDTGERLARLLHVDPAVEAGDEVAVGDSLGTLVRAGFFAPWVANHLHLGFREHGADPYRASGSLPLELDPALRVAPLDWDGTGTVVARGETYALLDEPAHPDPGAHFVGVGNAPGGRSAGDGAGPGVLDGGFPHYDRGGLLPGGAGGENPGGSGAPVGVAGRRIGTATGRDVVWDDVRVLANGEEIRGVAFCCARDAFGAKLVFDGADLAVGEDVTVTVEPAGDRAGD